MKNVKTGSALFLLGISLFASAYSQMAYCDPACPGNAQSASPVSAQTESLWSKYRAEQCASFGFSALEQNGSHPFSCGRRQTRFF
jgi:hypothetical protein